MIIFYVVNIVFNYGIPYHIEISPLICIANQWNGHERAKPGLLKIKLFTRWKENNYYIQLFLFVFFVKRECFERVYKNKDYLFRLVKKEWLQKRIWAKKRIIFLVHGSSKNLPDCNFKNIFLEKFHRDSIKILWRNCFSRLTCEICLSWIDAFMTEVSII